MLQLYLVLILLLYLCLDFTAAAAPAADWCCPAAAAPGAANVSAQDPNICNPLSHLATVCKLDTGMSKMKGECCMLLVVVACQQHGPPDLCRSAWLAWAVACLLCRVQSGVSKSAADYSAIVHNPSLKLSSIKLICWPCPCQLDRAQAAPTSTACVLRAARLRSAPMQQASPSCRQHASLITR
jgi:hypothetical protein